MLLFATFFSVAGDTNINETNNMGNATLVDVFTMTIEDTMSVPGAENHSIPITGEWSEAFQRVVMKILIDRTDFDGFRILIDGSVLEGLGSGAFQVYPTYINIFWTSYEGNAIPAGEGTLITLEIDISTDAPEGIKYFNFTDYSPSIPTAYYPDRNNFDNPYIPDLFNGTLIIGYNYPPETPEIEGPNEGIINEEYEFSIVANDNDGNDLIYHVNWGDSEEDFGPYPANESFQTTHSWSVADTYEITVIANDGYADSPEATHSIEIREPLPEIEIGEITGGLLGDGTLSVDAVIKNIGDGDATNVNWSITLEGGFILKGAETSGTIESIPAGDEVTVSSDNIIGIGRPTITVEASESEGSSDTGTANGLVLLILLSVS